MRVFVAAAIIALAFPAHAGTVNFELNEVGVGGLEQMLDIARRSASTMREADMAVSLYNALQQAKLKAMQADQQAAQAAEQHVKALEAEKAKAAQRLKDLEAENAKLKEAEPK